jgi:hypothetical protein
VFAGLSTGLAFTEARFPKLTTWGTGAAVAALAGFALITLSTVMIWRPFQGVFSLDSALIVGSYVEADPAALLPEIHRELALHLGNHTAYNRIELDRRLMWFRAALGGLLGVPLRIVSPAANAGPHHSAST